jgi:hypothetical protein
MRIDLPAAINQMQQPLRRHFAKHRGTLIDARAGVRVAPSRAKGAARKPRAKMSDAELDSKVRELATYGAPFVDAVGLIAAVRGIELRAGCRADRDNRPRRDATPFLTERAERAPGDGIE